MREVEMNKKAARALSELPQTLAIKRRAGPNLKGQPDLTGCSHGYRIELEGKLPGNRPTPLQEMWLKRWHDAGAITGVYYSVAEAVAIVTGGLRDRGVELPG